MDKKKKSKQNFRFLNNQRIKKNKKIKKCAILKDEKMLIQISCHKYCQNFYKDQKKPNKSTKLEFLIGIKMKMKLKMEGKSFKVKPNRLGLLIIRSKNAKNNKNKNVIYTALLKKHNKNMPSIQIVQCN